MKTPRKRITFKTPKKRQTPLVKNTISKKRVEKYTQSSSSPGRVSAAKKTVSESSVYSTSANEIDGLIDKKEKENMKMYRAENQYLRELKSDAELFKKFTGIEISEHDGAYVISQSVAGRDGLKAIKFELKEDDNAYIYKLVQTNCVDLPDFLQEDISFECREIHKFFFKVLEVLVAKNV